MCGGFAEYYETDAKKFRVAAALLILLFGSGLWAYALAALFMKPEPKYE